MPTHKAPSRPRDPRLDFFRGAAMLIILVAHIPGNGWTLWIPARFGFSDATEIFVFSSGLASALAFGGVFLTRGWLLGSARIAHRVWQVYWAHVGVFLVTAAMLAGIQMSGLGVSDLDYLTRPYVVPLFDRTAEALTGLLTLRYVPGLFDILPMYLVILAMTPVLMALHRAGGGPAVAAFMAASWLAATTAGAAYRMDGAEAQGLLGQIALAIGSPFAWMNFPGTQWGDGTWFFNPFAWQLVFFTGFAFGMGWLSPPPVSRTLTRVALAVVALSLPLAWFRLYGGMWIPRDWAVTQALWAAREWSEPLHSKTWFGVLRYVHFLAIAYLAWASVGPLGRALSRPLPTPPVARGRPWAPAAIALLTAPYAQVDAIRALAPALDAWLLRTIPIASPEAIGWLSLLHFCAVVLLLWRLAPHAWLARLADEGWLTLVRVLRRVGSQSLAVFMTSIPLSQLCGLAIDHLGAGLTALAVVNLAGMGVLVGTAYLVAWFKSQPWRREPVRVADRAPLGTPAE